ncbi:MAG: protein kinase [Verrucomicrobiaceae bacterium]|nr:protein kinase [Verrucomicrobiaceae bacterium]
MASFEVIEKIGRGGMGEVYRAWQPSLGRTVAVKVLPSSEGRPDALERFENEARVLGRLEHPNIMPIHDLGRDAEGRAYYSMKLVKGRTLQQILDDLRGGDVSAAQQYPLAALLTVFDKICDAVSFAHSQGILHRDLKPDNIMVGEFGEVLVVDWGLAKVRSCEGRTTEGVKTPAIADVVLGMTLEGDVMGTPQYMSPEQAEGQADDLDERSDVFSLGGVLYAILTLHPPVEGENATSVLKRVREGAVTPPSTRGTQAQDHGRVAAGEVLTPAQSRMEQLPHCPGGRVPLALSAVVMKALRVDRGSRYQSVTELQAEVLAYQRGFATNAEGAGAWRQLHLLMLRHKSASCAMLALVVLSVGFVFKLVHSEKQARHSAEAANAAKIEAQARGEAERQARAQSQLALASAAYRAHDSKAMKSALDGVPENLRDKSWQYLRLRADNSTCQIEAGGSSIFMGAAPHPKRPGVFAMIDGKSGQIALVDAPTGFRVAEIHATERQRAVLYDAWALDFSPDGSLLVSGRPDSAGACVYDVVSGKPLGDWPPMYVAWARFHPDGKRVILATDASILSMHNAITGEKLWQKPLVSRAIFLPSGQIVAVYGGALRILDDATGDELRRFSPSRARIQSLDVSRDGSVLFLGGDDGWVRACKVANEETLFKLPVSESAQQVHVALSGDGRRLLVAAGLDSGGRVVRILDATTGRTLQNLMGGAGVISAVGMHPLSGDVVVSGPDTRAWSNESLPFPERSLFANHLSSAFWGAGDMFLNDNRVIPLSNNQPGTATVTLPIPKPPTASLNDFWCANAVGDIAALAMVARGAPVGRTTPSNLYTVRREGGTYRLGVTAKSQQRVESLFLNADGSRLAASNGAQLIEIFDTKTGQRICECDVQLNKIHCELAWLGISRLAGIGFDHRREIFVWDAETGAMVGRVKSPSRVLVLASSVDGKQLAEGGEDRRVRIRDADTLQVKTEFVAHDAGVTALAFHPSLPLLATGSRDRSVRLWNMTGHKLVRELEPSSEAIVHLSFSPDGEVLACADHAHFTHFVRPVGKH